MARFLGRSIVSTLTTMLLVSIALFFLLEVGGGDVTVKILGIFATPAQRASYRAQLGLDQPAWLRYLDWLVGNDWRVRPLVGHPLVTVRNAQTGEQEWWADVQGLLTRWQVQEGQLIALQRQADGSTEARPVEEWRTDDAGTAYFWGVDVRNSAVRWVRGQGQTVYTLTKGGFREESDGPQRYIPLRKGLLRGDAGRSLQTGRPVMVTLLPRLRNSLTLAAVAFCFIMPLALALGVLAGINEGRLLDRVISVVGIGATATPEFVTGILLILVLGIWLRALPAVAVFLSADAIFKDPRLLALPVLTLTAAELGYVTRMTRASMVEVMQSPYIRTAILKGLPYWRVVLVHAVRNALLAPVTVIMLHVNWLVGGLVIVETIFGFPGLGTYIYDAAIFGDVNAIEAAAMLTVAMAVATRLLGDLAYTLLNPRIRYA
jgi:peptide/nickel transport system permease protein